MILVGTSGFHFEDWKGVFYPSHLKKSEWLSWYVRHFPTLEINSTYYRVPSVRTFEGFDERTPDGYPIVLKVHGDVTHKREHTEWSIGHLLESAEPIRRSGKIAALLAQFPWGFRSGPENRDYLGRVRDAVPEEIPLFVEFRHAGWISESTFRFLRNSNIGYCSVDEPNLKGLVPSVAFQTNGCGYVRLHGRNRESWWDSGEKSEGKSDRYDHLYTEEELKEWVGKIRDLQKQADRTFVYFNNCYAGQAIRGAKLMQAMLDLPRTGEEQTTLDL